MDSSLNLVKWLGQTKTISSSKNWVYCSWGFLEIPSMKAISISQLSVYFGETDHVIPWQTDHLNCWRTIAADAIGMVSKVMI